MVTAAAYASKEEIMAAFTRKEIDAAGVAAATAALTASKPATNGKPKGKTYADQGAILAALATNEIDAAEAGKLLTALNANKPAGRLSYKVSEKGACSVYGMGRFPLTLYKEQWQRLLADEQIESIKAFLKVNDSLLTSKGDK